MPIDDDRPGDDGANSAHGTNTTTLTVSSAVSGKRKALEFDDPSDSQSVLSSMPPPSSSARTTSVTSSAKRRKPMSEGLAAASMRSSRDSTRNAEQDDLVSGTVGHQQLVSRFDVLMDRISTEDPFTARQVEAMHLLETDTILFDLNSATVASMAMAFSNRPACLTPYLTLKQDAARYVLILKMTQQENSGI